MDSISIKNKTIYLEKDERTLKIYKKYLGEDFIPKEFYTTIIGNHATWSDILFILKLEAPSFVAKKSVQDYPIIGGIARSIQCMWIERGSKNARAETIALIEERQKELEAGKLGNPVTIFPEGTSTNGKYIINFKKGAFFRLSHIKPYITVLPQDGSCWSLAHSGMGVLPHMIMTVLLPAVNVTSLVLPVIQPTDYMFTKYSNLGVDKPEIYTNVARHIMSEVSGLKLINANYEQKLNYMSTVKGKIIKDT